jgi:anion-transporting  ArsA/GET3 family ATPase
MKPPSLDLRKFRLVVCLGPGGVGKTTLSAALAVAGAAAGRAVDVMTVDPAPRLLDALGLDAADAAPREVALDGVAPARRGSRHAARLRAMRLDPKRTFDAIIARHAPSDAARDAILENRIYRNLSNALAGVGDYMAMEKLLELADEPTTELVVLDTPPAGEALDFLDAPRRILELLNSRAVSLLGAPAGILRSRLRVVDLAARAVLAAFDRITGLNLLGDVQSFVRSFDGMYLGFAERAGRAAELLRASTTAIVVVTTAESARIAEALEFTEALERAGLAVNAIIVNRVMAALPDVRKIAGARLPAGLKRKLRRNLNDYAALRRREAASMAELRKSLGDRIALIAAPDLGREPRRLSELAELGRNLTAA